MRMLSTNSLAAFSGVPSAIPPTRPAEVRPVRDQRDAPPLQALPQNKPPVPDTPPAGFTPRGSLLNLSV